jgi:membrane-bound ClpP family serine protease
MSLLAISLLILLGILLFVIEFLVVPGITIAGIGGAILIFTGIYLSYDLYGFTTGNIMVASTVFLMIITMVVSLKSKTWTRTMLNSQIDGRVNVFDNPDVKPGDTGKAITRLAPMGKVEVNGSYYEAKANDILVDQDTDIVVVKVYPDKLIVKPKNQ